MLEKIADTLEVSVDCLIKGEFQKADSYIHDRELLNQFIEIEKLNFKQKETVKIFLDAFLSKKK